VDEAEAINNVVDLLVLVNTAVEFCRASCPQSSAKYQAESARRDDRIAKSGHATTVALDGAHGGAIAESVALVSRWTRVLDQETQISIDARPTGSVEGKPGGAGD
jgi:hypothetical protein